METEIFNKRYKLLNKYTRGLVLLTGDFIAIVLSCLISYQLLAVLLVDQFSFIIGYSALMTLSILTGLGLFKMYVVTWRYTGLRELIRLILGITAGGLFTVVISNILWEPGNTELNYMALVLANSILLIGAFRISKRVLIELVDMPGRDKKHAIILGGGTEGEQILRDIRRNSSWNLFVNALFDERSIPGVMIHGVRCRGGLQDMYQYLESSPTEMMIVAYPEIPKSELKDIIDNVKSIRPKMEIKILPSFHHLTDDPVGVKNIRDISIEDILGRDPVKLDMNSIAASISNKTVLISGAGGSIGSELVRQCVKLGPSQLIALDIDETELFHVENELAESGIDVIPCVASVIDEHKIDQILNYYRPDVIFHAAAYKHVPMLESYPEEAVKVNIGGTRILAELACKYMVDKFVMVSTDKAVNPTNVMGATKRVAEEICMSYNGDCVTKFISVRFGNVLGSRGSVVPLFMEQIKNGGPVTLTDDRMQRYFMTIPEAVLLVMQAGSMGKGGEVFVLDMGEPVKIIDMAHDLIRLHGLEPGKDINIEVTGLRPGEKLFEELLNAEEGVLKTEHVEIFKAICSSKLTKLELEMKIMNLFNLIDKGATASLRTSLQEIVPTYSFKDELRNMGLGRRELGVHKND
ncbi:polysaccharide biosynthesis protein [Rhodohalobacter barkolensis]|uniref:Polysaccharide biosynthesis protein n=1 Tax=Rhodohalobacter barkolensis TaxID=2053187 RepID=A0A2N0VGB0_9BACT|nr:nucleoside-diphosphate sugar epimerase/dehydratase [Rhodohalobacter barkolensis]PKD43223.1 polysaccharide biosynthesis protein [Rhodohalobacter barkolensis]